MRVQVMWTMPQAVAAARFEFVSRSMCRAAALLFGLAGIGAAHASIPVAYDGPPSANSCTLAQAINAANAANGLDPASYGSSTPPGNCSNAVAGPNTIALSISTVTLTTIDNYWYGPNALPPLASSVSISAIGQVATIKAVHTGDPTPATANAFRFFYVSGGMELPAGSLSLLNLVLQSGYAKGGDSNQGGGGAGMGGAVFNQGSLTLVNVALIGNTAQGGATNGNVPFAGGGGGMGQDATSFPENGAGFGGSLGTGGPYGGSGGAGFAGGQGGGGGGGFIALSNGGNGSPPFGGNGGGSGGLGGQGGGNEAGGYGGSGGDGGGGGFGCGGLAGGFGVGGTHECQGGGVGGGGGDGVNYNGGGAGGGFGGGGGYGYGNGGGGFGGGSGYGAHGYDYPRGGFGGGFNPGGGAGMGGAIFNHTGTVTLLNVSAIGNAANGGGAGAAACNTTCGSGLGAVVFNLNGTVTIDYSTLAGNFLSGNNSGADSSGPEDGTIYSLAYGNKIQDGTASTAALTIRNSIVHGTHPDAGLQSDVSTNVVDGANTNTSSLVYAGKNFIGQSYSATAVTQTGPAPSALDPLLGALSLYVGPANANATPVLPIGSNSPAYNAAASCLEADESTTLTIDQRTAARPQFGQCDVGAYEFDGDYIFAGGFQPRS